MTGSRYNTSLFDKLTAGAQFSSAKTADANARGILESLREFIAPNADQFGEGPLRDAIRRDVSWLLNTASLEAAIDLTNYPQVATSVLNFGVPELAGKATNTASIQSHGVGPLRHSHSASNRSRSNRDWTATHSSSSRAKGFCARTPSPIPSWPS